MRKIIKMFEEGNVSIFGLRGKGKDMLMANVAVRRKLPYVSNTNYGGQWIKFEPSVLDCKNYWRNFMTEKLNYYEFPYPDGTDIYIADIGVYMPSQNQGELCREYPYIPAFMAMSRQLGQCNLHFNVQGLSRCWDKIREQSDLYIRCVGCLLPFANVPLVNKTFLRNLVIQKVIIYEKYESANNKVPVFRLRRPWLSPTRLQLWEIQKSNYDIAHGLVTPRYLIYFNKSNYDTRIFKEMLKNA